MRYKIFMINRQTGETTINKTLLSVYDFGFAVSIADEHNKIQKEWLWLVVMEF